MTSLKRTIAQAFVYISLAHSYAATGSDSPLPADDTPTLNENWQPARTLVWATPGEGGTALEPGNWMIRASGSLAPLSVNEVPTLSEAGLVLLALLMVFSGLVYLRRSV